MKKRIFLLLLALIAALGLLTGCGSIGGGDELYEAAILSTPAPGDELRLITEAPQEIIDAPPGVTPGPDWTVAYSPAEGTVTYSPPSGNTGDNGSALPDPGPDETLLPPGETVPPAAPEPVIDENGEYTAPQDVADYIHLYGHLPDNFITKREARDLGWSGGNLWKYAPFKSIGGDYFGNYEGLLPKGSYHECDVNYSGGSRGAERLIYGDDGSIYYTNDHYESFTQLY